MFADSQAPPGYVFLVLLVVPVVYSLPISMLTAEMATALPDGGMVDWIQEACGPVLGSHTTYWIWATYVFDAAIYPVLAGEYLAQEVDFSWAPGGAEMGQDLFVIILISLVTIIKVIGMDVFVKFSTVLATFSLLPIVIYLGYGLPHLQWGEIDAFNGDYECNITNTGNATNSSQLVGTALNATVGLVQKTIEQCSHEDPDFSQLIPWTLWLYSGFFSLGAIAGDVHQPKRTFPIVIAMLLPLVMLLNTIPLAIALSVDGDLSNYSAGYFNQIAGMLAGQWLTYFFIVAAIICLVGLYSAQVLVAEESTACFVYASFPDAVALNGSLARSGRLMHWLLDGTNGNAPIWVIFNGLCSMALAFLPYQLLVQFTMLIHVPPTLLFVYAYMYYKVRHPNIPRPINIPGGIPMGLFMSAGPTAATLVNFYYSVTDSSETLGIPYLQAYSLVLIVGLGIIVHLGYVVSGSAVYSIRSSNSRASYADMFRYETIPEEVPDAKKKKAAFESAF
jgi:amino acid transporter